MIDPKKYVKIISRRENKPAVATTREVVTRALNITPSTSAQTFVAPDGVDGYNPVSVSAVNSSIDSNIVAGNIKSGVNILGVVGNYGGGSSATIEPIGITPTTSQQIITASGGVDGYSPITVSGVTSSIDANITANNIKSGVSILGVSGNVVELNGTTKSITPTTSQQTVSPTSPNNAFTQVTVQAVTSSIDANITAGNIKSGVTILGVTGTAELAPEYYIEKRVSGGTLINYAKLIDFTGITNIGDEALIGQFSRTAFPENTSVDLSSLTAISGTQACAEMCYNCSGIKTVDMRNVVSISSVNACMRMFSNCSDLTSANLSSLTTISGQSGCNALFEYCSSLNSIDISSLTTISGYASCQNMFYSCVALTGTIDLSSLTTISGNSGCNQMFYGCYGITGVNLSSLKTVSGNYCCQNMFLGCSSLSSLSFPALKSNSFGSYTNQFYRMLSGVTGCTVHFPSNLQSVIGSWSDVVAGFGGTNTTVLFDLPATT